MKPKCLFYLTVLITCPHPTVRFNPKTCPDYNGPFLKNAPLHNGLYCYSGNDSLKLYPPCWFKKKSQLNTVVLCLTVFTRTCVQVPFFRVTANILEKPIKVRRAKIMTADKCLKFKFQGNIPVVCHWHLN